MLRSDAIEDSNIPTIPEESLPNITLEQAKKIDGRINYFDNISAIFLLLDNYGQAYSLCMDLENGKNPFGQYPGFISVLVDHIHQTKMANGYNKIYCVLYLLNRFKTSKEVLGVQKNQLIHFFKDREYHYVPSIRFSLFKLCQRWTKQQWSGIVKKIRSLYSLKSEELCCKEFETNLIQMFLKNIIVNDGPNLKFKSSVEHISPELLHFWIDVVPPTISFGCDEKYETSRGGFVLVINNENYRTSEFSVRNGSKNDVKSIEETFSRFGCKVTVKSDLDINGLYEVVSKYSKKTNYESYDYFILFILAHGTCIQGAVDVIYGVDGKPLNLNFIRDSFIKVNNCGSLVGKPKIFFIQACRGNESMRSLPVISPDSKVLGHVAEIEGCLVFKSTWEGYVSYRHDLYGTFFVQYLCKEIKEFGGKKTLSDHCNAVQDHLRSFNKQYAQIASYDYSLGKKSFYFTIKSRVHE
ncbi:caspase-8 [Lepeophtheirus salmonis]|uniref:Caspase 3, apoptosisrelated cysteine peptidase [Melopsittacus undulatus] n=1 Tax=Lepeophtheirus salmonis TaxID=72036 RepID=A0A0K2VH22_LEPSM|nr:caspase-8-like [Lepeophtheirus salmonis]